MSAVHERLITLAKARRILSNPDLVHYDMAHGALRLQIPGVKEARLGSRHVAVPSQALVHYISCTLPKDVLQLRVKARLLVSDAGTLIGACEAGAGIAQVLEIGSQQSLHSGRLIELFPEWSDERFPLYAIYPSRLHRAAKVRAFIEFCLEIMDG